MTICLLDNFIKRGCLKDLSFDEIEVNFHCSLRFR